MDYTLTYRGPFKPYVRMTQRGKWCDPEAQEYLASQAALKAALQEQLGDRPMLPARTPLGVDIVIARVGGLHNRDIDNEGKALLDALSGVALPDDRWVDELHIIRRRDVADAVYIEVRTLEVTR